jgi:hypothetical protein
MDHQRTLIRLEVVRRLKASRVVGGQTLYATLAGQRIYPGRVLPTHVELFPALLVYDEDENSPGEYQEGLEKRLLTLTVEAQATANTAEELDLLLDALALTIERMVLADRLQNRLAVYTRYTRTQKDRNYEGDRPFGWAWLDFEIEYAQPGEAEPGTIDDFLLFHADYDLAPRDGAIDMVDDVHLPSPEEP